MKNEILTVCDQLVAAALNGVCQGMLVVLLVWAGLRALGRGTNAATRHAIWFATLVLLALILPANCFRSYFALSPAVAPPNPGEAEIITQPADSIPSSYASRHGNTLAFWSDGFGPNESRGPEISASTQAGSMETVAVLESETVDSWIDLRPDPGFVALPLRPEEPIASSAPQPDGALQSKAPIPPLAQAILDAVWAQEATASEEVTMSYSSWDAFKNKLGSFTSAIVNPVSWKVTLGETIPKFASVLLAGLGLIIVSLRVSILIGRLVRIRRLKREALPPGSDLNELFLNLHGRLGVKRTVNLGVSPAHRSPLLLGFFHPMILLPMETTPEEAEPVLRHELAHVARSDDWANLVQHFIHALFFFHPGVWWISRQLSLEREIACDDAVLHQSGRPRAYALLLANLAGRMQGRPALLAPGASTHKSQLQQRIDMILDTKRNASPRLAKTRLSLITSAAAIVAIAAIYSAPRVVLAQGETASLPAAAPSEDEAPQAGAPIGLPPVSPPIGGFPVSVPVFAQSAEPASWAESDEPALAPPATVSEPKIKAVRPGAQNIWRPVVPATPALPAVASVPDAPRAPLAPTPRTPRTVIVNPTPPGPVIALTQPAPEPVRPVPPRPARSPRTPQPRAEDSSLEERLARLERMVESLMAQPKFGPGQPQFHMKGPEVMIDRKEIEKMAEKIRKEAVIPQKELEKIKQLAEQEASKAREQVRRAMKEAEKATKDQKRELTFKFKEDSQKQLQALRKQIEELERQRERLDRQIDELEHKQDQLDEEQESDDEEQVESDLESQDGKAGCAAEKAAAQ